MALTKIISKVRALAEDFGSSDYQTFTYTSSAIFKVALNNATVTSVSVNGGVSGVAYTYNSTSQEVTITSTLVAGDVIIVNFTYNDYSTDEIKEYIRAALVYMSIYSYSSDEDYELEDDSEIYPTPSNRESDVISLIAGILIKPNYTEYKTSSLTVKYPRRYSKEEKIKKLIDSFIWTKGKISILEWD